MRARTPPLGYDEVSRWLRPTGRHDAGVRVADGHHRVALSRQRGIEVITAEVTRIHSGRFEP